jgi:hypothetical protein
MGLQGPGLGAADARAAAYEELTPLVMQLLEPDKVMRYLCIPSFEVPENDTA